jgi:Protein of unknown function DUF262
MKRRPTTQDITWLLDLARNKQLNLEPPYQRRSVWTRQDRQFFLDTIFRDYPSPAIFLHKTISDAGQVTYHVVDGKQRLQTILDFAGDKIAMAKDYGDARLDGKKWSSILQGDDKLKHQFWNYQISVEMVDRVEGSLINEVFDRLNRNARKLTRQELRHAKFEGWFATQVEKESEKEAWKVLGVVTTARIKRMADTQFISELMLVVLENAVLGFDQDILDSLYAKYDDTPEDSEITFSEEKFTKTLSAARSYLSKMEEEDSAVSQFAQSFTHFYTLWCVVALNLAGSKAKPAEETAKRYISFMKKVEALAAKKDDLESFIKKDTKNSYKAALSYYTQTRGASTDLTPRQERYEVLKRELLG